MGLKTTFFKVLIKNELKYNEQAVQPPRLQEEAEDHAVRMSVVL